MKEKYNLEFKEKVTDSFLRTVSAFANYQGGVIKFGVTDEGKLTGIHNPKDASLRIENRINDNISPIPRYTLDVEKGNVINLRVFPGFNKPYFYKSKAYMRSDTSTIQVDSQELKRLIMQGENTTYDSLVSNEQNLSFVYLEDKLISTLGISRITEDILLTLELLDRKKRFTNAGKLLSDRNKTKGIDIIKFGQKIDVILHRYTLDNMSLLEVFDRATEIYKENYQYEVIDGLYRKNVERVPEKAFREVIANALVHRDWLIPSNIQISMKDNAIEITSPGRLPDGISEQEYLHGQISVMRNPIIGNIFFRLKIIEAFGTGITKIHEAYSISSKKPVITFFENSIQIILPVISDIDVLTDDEKKVYLAIQNKEVSSSKISKATGFGKNKVLGILVKLIDEGFAVKTGEGRGTKYVSK